VKVSFRLRQRYVHDTRLQRFLLSPLRNLGLKPQAVMSRAVGADEVMAWPMVMHMLMTMPTQRRSHDHPHPSPTR